MDGSYLTHRYCALKRPYTAHLLLLDFSKDEVTKNVWRWKGTDVQLHKMGRKSIVAAVYNQAHPSHPPLYHLGNLNGDKYVASPPSRMKAVSLSFAFTFLYYYFPLPTN